jgi:hypothetical protein
VPIPDGVMIGTERAMAERRSALFELHEDRNPQKAPPGGRYRSRTLFDRTPNVYTEAHGNRLARVCGDRDGARKDGRTARGPRFPCASRGPVGEP